MSLAVLAVFALLAGCQTIGPRAIGLGRANYNNEIQATAKAQVLANIVRVHNREPTLFLDVSGVDAIVTASATASLSVSNIGAKAGSLGGVTPSATYSEVPTIHYSTLTGQALVQQITSPISADSLAYLFDSNWQLAPVLQLTVDRLTPAASDYGAALNAIVQLDDYGALVMSAFPSSWSALALRAGVSGSVPMAPNDALLLQLQPDRPVIIDKLSWDDTRRNIAHLWIRLLRIYQTAEPENVAFLEHHACKSATAIDACLDALDKSINGSTAQTIDQLLSELPHSIELQTKPSPRELAPAPGDPVLTPKATARVAAPAAQPTPGAEQPPQASPLENLVIDAPVLRTRSALGTLKSSAEYASGVRFVTPEQYADIRGDAWNSGACGEGRCLTPCVRDRGYYLLLSGPADAKPSDLDRRIQLVDGDKAGCKLFTVDPAVAFEMSGPDAVGMEEELIGQRVFILIVKGPPPADAYATFSEGGASYYIAADDDVSKVNFALIGQILTMQAIAAPTTSSSPVVAITQ